VTHAADCDCFHYLGSFIYYFTSHSPLSWRIPVETHALSEVLSRWCAKQSSVAAEQFNGISEKPNYIRSATCAVRFHLVFVSCGLNSSQKTWTGCGSEIVFRFSPKTITQTKHYSTRTLIHGQPAGGK
jgi:hypothetical protein